MEALIVEKQILKRGYSAIYEKEYRRKDGTVFPIELRAILARDDEGKPSGIWAIVRDISERKQTQEALRLSEEHFRLVVESAPDAIFIRTGEGTFAYLNAAAVRLFGAKSAVELLGQSIMDRFHPAYHALILERIRKLNEDGKAAPLMERQYVKLDGSTVDVEASAVPFTHQNKKGALVFVRDITKRKQVEEELKKHRDRLEELVKDRTDELSKANELLKKENEVRKTTEAALRSRERELEGRRHELEEINSALKVLLRQREEDKKNIELNIVSNIKISVMPYLEKLESSCSEGNQTVLAIMKSHLNEIASPFIRKISSEYLGFTPNEIRIASLIKEGKTSKEIAEILNVSLNTIMTHRHNIRKKTRLKNKKVNLRSYLQTLE